jgi:paraquat-inducible protein B
MSKMANKSVIGAFVVGAIALAVVAVVIFGSGKFFRKQLEFITFFQGSIKGLNVGSPVNFRGVKIGEVKNIHIQARPSDMTFQIPVLLEIDPSVIESVEPGVKIGAKPYAQIQGLIDKGMRAQLQSQSFVTGQLAVALDFHPDKPPVVVAQDKKYHEIPSVPTPIEELQKTIADLNLKEFAEKVKATLDGIEKAINSPEIPKTLKSVSVAADEVKVLMKNTNDTVKDVQKLVQGLDRQVATLGPNANETVKDAQKLVQNLDRQVTTLLPSIEAAMKDAQKMMQHIDTRIDPMAANAEEAMKGINSLVNNDVKKLVGNLDQGVAKVMPEIAKSLETLRATLQEAQGALRSVGGSAGAQSPLMYQLTKTLEELANAAQSLRSMADYLEQHPESLIRGK